MSSIDQQNAIYIFPEETMSGYLGLILLFRNNDIEFLEINITLISSNGNFNLIYTYFLYFNHIIKIQLQNMLKIHFHNVILAHR